MQVKQKIMRGVIDILCVPSIFIRNKTRKEYFRKNVERFIESFSRSKKLVFAEFDRILMQIPYSEFEKRKAKIQFRMLYHFTGLSPEDYQTIGGLRKTSFFTKCFCSVSRWRQNLFQFSVNKFNGNEENRQLLDDKGKFNTLFDDLIGREWILSNVSEKEITDFMNILVRQSRPSGVA